MIAAAGSPAACSARMASKPAQNSDGAVEAAGVGDGIDMRAGSDRRQVRLGADPAGERIADGILANARPAAAQRLFDSRRGPANRFR